MKALPINATDDGSGLGENSTMPKRGTKIRRSSKVLTSFHQTFNQTFNQSENGLV